MGSTPKRQFQLGEQPNWIGQEECKDVGEEFVAQLLKESSTNSLIERGYAVVPLPEKTTKLYSDFHEAFECFSHSSEDNKRTFATLFTDDKYSPNQFHGYSEVAGLKEQFMMRACGRGTKLISPKVYETPEGKKTADLGITGMNLYESLDMLCRSEEYKVCEALGIDKQLVDKVLDPINKTGCTASRPSEESLECSTDFMMPNYISSSIMDNFHYYNQSNFGDTQTEQKIENKGVRKEEQFFNNHASHSDSGLMTVVIVTDEPGLEVFDQKEQCWIALEKLLHSYLKKLNTDNDPHFHRRYATLFWGDSHVYLGNKLHELMHRVASSKKERYSVVFKQRTSPTATAPRYQEDYELGMIQLKAIDANNPLLKKPDSKQ